MNKEISCGAVLYRRTDEGIRYLIVIDRNDNYGFPKGHQERGESFIETAQREIKEEVGLDVKITEDFICSYDYPIKEGTVLKEVHYYVAEIDNEEPYTNDGEIKEIMFKGYEEALELLNFKQSKELLRKVEKYLNNR
ncbi:MAG: NUDIX domain-containing protein [Erysipelotrichaceae bacterium]|nr:NUDIX domain-containing protein [Erysipelotrichaceae bacterium]